MKIAKLDVIPLKIPFSTGPVVAQMGGRAWNTQEVTLVRLETSDGIVGWGEAFSYTCQRPVVAAIEDMIAPLAVGRVVEDIESFLSELQQTLHLFGRYGVVMFGFSGLDIALWDALGKSKGVPIARLIDAEATLEPMQGYSSLYRYGDAELVRQKCRESLDLGYRIIKLHEITEAEVCASRQECGDDIAITVDTNCPWTREEARKMALTFKPYDLMWLEEPIFPPDDYDGLAELQSGVGIPLAAGENLCTRYQFAQMIAAGAVSYVQPSVTKVGGITEMLAVAEQTRAAGLNLMPHAPYFGPGFIATLQVMAALEDSGYVERLFVDHEATLYGDYINPVNGMFRVPDGPGLGVEPDEDVIRDYRVEL